MNIQRFYAPTSREALAKARLAFGEGTLILSNRPTANGVEIVATAEDVLASVEPSAAAAAATGDAALAVRRQSAKPAASTQALVEADADQLAMSTLSFQDYVRERMLRRRHEALKEQKAEPAPAVPTATSQNFNDIIQAARAEMPAPVPVRVAPAVKPQPAPAMPVQAVSQGIMDELHAMSELIEEKFNTLTWLGQARQHPIQSNLMLKLIRAGLDRKSVV